jgi:hypothetical protein
VDEILEDIDHSPRESGVLTLLASEDGHATLDEALQDS